MNQTSHSTRSGACRRVGLYVGTIAPGWHAFSDCFENLARHLQSPGGQLLSEGRNRNVRTQLAAGEQTADVVVKAFGRQSAVKDRMDRLRGSKAFRTWRAAVHLQRSAVGTPAPVGFLERWRAGRLVESYFISEYLPEVVSFRDELIRLFREDPECRKFMQLLRTVADAVRGMHESGFVHNDLGNQNILLRRTEGGWSDVRFIDLNRGRIRERLSVRERARDLSRIFLPSDLLRVFLHMYHDDRVAPPGFDRFERLCRTLYAVHASTRSMRHPLREWRRRKGRDACASAEYPLPRDMWIWDERSAQAIATMTSRDRHHHYAFSWIAKPVAATVRGALPVRALYRRLLDECYARPVSMDGTVGVAVDPREGSWDRERQLLDARRELPVIVRLYHHEDHAARAFRARAVKELAAAGRSVSVALVQDRSAALRPASWRRFVDWALGETAGVVDWVEAGHAVNRVKWGIWTFAEHRRLMEAVAEAAAGGPRLKLMGPAAIDFEYPFVLAALSHLPDSMRLGALSHHLYVDRRGAPENRQGPFDALRKFALARAIARWAPACDDRLIVSEVNWPLRGTGVYSPVGSPYESPGPRFGDPSVSELEYAAYMIRYLAIAICSGMVERVYWWRLVARGFGLVDDTAPDALRERPAYRALLVFLSTFAGATYRLRVAPGPDDPAAEVHLLRFDRPDSGSVYLAWSSGATRTVRMPGPVSAAFDLQGRAVAVEASGVVLTGCPVYLCTAP